MRKTVLIFGISSFVGSNLAEVLKDDFRVVGTYFQNPISIPGVTCMPCDILKKDYVTKIVAIVKPDITIYAVGLSSLTECKLKPKLSDALNSVGAVNACTASERYRSKFVYLSSAFVHSGDSLPHHEGDTPFPNTAYGTSLSSTEFYIQRSCLNYLIFRCSAFYGRSPGARHPNWFEYLQASLAKSEKFLVDDSVKMGFLDIHLMGRIMKKAIDADVTNRLLQVSSEDAMTRFEFAKLYARIFKLDVNLIQRYVADFPVEKRDKKANSEEYAFEMSTANLEAFWEQNYLKLKTLVFTHKRLMNVSEKNS